MKFCIKVVNKEDGRTNKSRYLAQVNYIEDGVDRVLVKNKNIRNR